MSSWIRFLRASVALGLVAGFLGTPVGLAHPGDMQHGPWDGIPGPGPEAGTRLSSAVTVTSHGHCFTCHWFQSFRTSFTSGPSATLGCAETSRLPEAAHPVRDEFAALHLAPRAPPSA
jgi:hypothetical protein